MSLNTVLKSTGPSLSKHHFFFLLVSNVFYRMRTWKEEGQEEVSGSSVQPMENIGSHLMLVKLTAVGFMPPS